MSWFWYFHVALSLKDHLTFLSLLCLICKTDLLGLREPNERVSVRGLCLLEGPKETRCINNQNFKLKYSSVFCFSTGANNLPLLYLEGVIKDKNS